jgi:N-acetylgalactosamine-N,N'-diacetylbacillosaminyl-diphospho-undecaprenol 4-alpha-N-acetylgalactosaminyltransferase
MKKKLSILIYSLAGGGAERVVSILLHELKTQYEITLFLMNPTIVYEIPNDTKIIYLENSMPHESGIKKLLKLPWLAWKYKKLNKSDISFSFMNRPNYVNALAKIFGMKAKIILSERIAPSQEYPSNGLKDKISRFLIKTLYSKSDLIIPNAQEIKYDLSKNFHLSNTIHVINNPIDIEKIAHLQEEDATLKSFSFITVGRFFEQKNHMLLLEAIKNVDAKLYIIGDGILREKLEHKIKIDNLENKVFLLGKQENPYKYLSKADCFVLSSDYEGFPNVLLEALACGLPIISTDCPSGPREILAPKTNPIIHVTTNIELAKFGVLTPVGDIECMREAMQFIINNPDQKEYYKNNAKIRASDFSKEHIIKQFTELLA